MTTTNLANRQTIAELVSVYNQSVASIRAAFAMAEKETYTMRFGSASTRLAGFGRARLVLGAAAT